MSRSILLHQKAEIELRSQEFFSLCNCAYDTIPNAFQAIRNMVSLIRMIPDTKKRIITTYLSKKNDVDLAYLFGSQATNRARKESDIDIAILFKDTAAHTFRLQGLIAEELTHALSVRVDVINLNATDAAFCHRVLLEGVILYETNPLHRIQFQTRSIRQYFDIKPSLDLYAQSLAQRARSGRIGEAL